jgi:two-component system OmpR family response regulator
MNLQSAPQCAPQSTPLTPQPTWTLLVTLKTYLVEDNPTIRDNLIATLEELACVDAVGTSDNENDGKEWLLNNPEQWDLAILDLFLKQGSGLGVLAACRDRKPTQKVVVLSNYATADIRQRCAQLGVDAVFDKSNEIDALLDYCRLQNDALG